MLDALAAANPDQKSTTDISRIGPVLIASDRAIERHAIALILKNHGLHALEASIEEAQSIVESSAKSGLPVLRILVDGDCDPDLAAAILESAKDAAGADEVRGAVLVGVFGRKSLDAFRTNGYSSYIVRPVRPQSLISQLGDGSVGTGAKSEATAKESPTDTTVLSLIREPKKRVLLVEDNAVNELLARRLLEKSGCEVITAADGIEAVDFTDAIRAGHEPPVSLILMDVQMPRMNGVEAAQLIKSAFASDLARLVCPPIVAITANAFAEDRERYLDAGMDDYLAKPFDAAALRALLARWHPQQVA